MTQIEVVDGIKFRIVSNKNIEQILDINNWDYKSEGFYPVKFLTSSGGTLPDRYIKQQDFVNIVKSKYE